MKALVVYDSAYGNTEKVARAIAGAIDGKVRAVRAGEVKPADFEGLDCLIVGSPTQGGRAMPAVQAFLNNTPAGGLRNVSVASFDTRMKKWVAKLFGYAAGRIAGSLKEKGGQLAAPPEGFFVAGREGPLMEGELERAAAWAKAITADKKQGRGDGV